VVSLLVDTGDNITTVSYEAWQSPLSPPRLFLHDSVINIRTLLHDNLRDFKKQSL
jgi:hypothetical protein